MHELLERARTHGAASLSGAELLIALDQVGAARRELEGVAVLLAGAIESRGPLADYRTTVDAVAIRAGAPSMRRAPGPSSGRPPRPGSRSRGSRCRPAARPWRPHCRRVSCASPTLR